MGALAVEQQEELNPKEQRFCAAYLVSGNALQSAITAGYSVASAKTTGPRLLVKAGIKAYLAKHATHATAKTTALKDKLLAELEAMAFANVQDFTRVDEDGLPQVDFSTATREQLRAVTSVSTKRTKRYDGKGNHVATDNNAKFTLADKYRGLELLGRHLGMFRAEEQRVIIDVADRLLKSRARVLKITSVTDVPDDE